jgi:hypothetical protein
MSIKIVIEVDAGSKNCGECPLQLDSARFCTGFDKLLRPAKGRDSLRCLECLVAEKDYKQK